ncbi:MAG: restriction endonuclease subunit S [Methylorubrum populi]
MTELPKGWVRTTIGMIADLANGRAFKPSDWTREGLPIIRIQNLNRPDAAFNHFSGPVSERHIVEDGDLLFAWSGTPGTSFGAHIWRGPTAVLNQHIFNIRVSPDHIDRDFLRLAINQTLDEQIAKAHGGAGLRHVTRKAFEETEIALPPLTEQRRIVERVRSLEERVALGQAGLDEALRSVGGARTALLQGVYALTLLPVERRARYGDEVATVSVGEVTTDMTYGSSTKSEKTGTIPVLRMGNIQAGELDWSDLVYTSNADEIERYALRPGDVLFNRTNSPQQVGKTAVYRGERTAIFAGYLIRVRCSRRMSPDFLAHCLNSPAGRQYSWLVKSDGVSQSNINSQKLIAFRLPCPSLEDQNFIVEVVRTGTARLKTVEHQVDLAREVLGRLHRRTIGYALSGRLGTGDLGDEPASIQVERLIEAKRARDLSEPTIHPGTAPMKRNVTEILSEADDWLPAQEVARLYGLSFGATPEDIEPFYAELRELDVAGQLAVKAVADDRGTKLSELLRLKASL